MSLKVDLDQMRSVGGHLIFHGNEILGLKFEPKALGADSLALKSVGAALRIQDGVLNTTLIPSCGERLAETGEIMGNCATMFQNQDEGKVVDLANMFTKATGAWGVQ
ncbi:hypothetical protein [Mycolicibacterium setense]|uniref:hypothetical protein n=1 Tax=Mycolicibacterium setense TaxID=431269 RepID=UPI0005735B8E|nr:hypothetical protein [Mycolicibacterium setense]KHO22099.1 hypothetical protein QQ25_16835 [Mycolicibacterium setense]MCV7113659.1 hypothetical protein [Mycolicibacterium setense]